MSEKAETFTLKTAYRDRQLVVTKSSTFDSVLFETADNQFEMNSSEARNLAKFLEDWKGMY